MAQGFDKMLVQNEKKYVKFSQNCSPYLSGEVGLFGIVPASKLIAKSIGFYVIRDEKGEWVPEPKEETDGSFKQADQDGPNEPGETGATVVTETKPEETVRPKTGRQAKRQRAKL